MRAYGLAQTVIILS